MSGGNFAIDYTPEEGTIVWQRIGSFGKIYNKFTEESGCLPSGKDVERMLSVVGSIANIPTKSSNCALPSCREVLNSHNRLMFCGACQSVLIDEENSPKKAEILSFLREKYPDLFSKALSVMPWKLS